MNWVLEKSETVSLSFKELSCEEKEKIRAMFEGRSEIKRGFLNMGDMTACLLTKIIQ